jgi:hypothetical protein
VGRDSSVAIANRYGLDGPEIESQPIPVAERSKMRVCGRSLDGVEGSNPARGMHVCVVSCRGISDKRTEDMKVHNG